MVWFALKDVGIVPASLSLFDSPQAILDDADRNDRQLYESIMSIEGDSIPEERKKEFEQLAIASLRLITRAVQLSPSSEEDAKTLAGKYTTDDSITAGSDIAQSPITEDQRTEIEEKLRSLKQGERGQVMSESGFCLRNSEFVREYLRFGHLELPRPLFEGERIAGERIELVRDANRLGAGITESLSPEVMESLSTPEEREAFIKTTYDPITGEIDQIAQRMYALAEERYALGDSEVGKSEPYEEVLFYTERASHYVLLGNFARAEAKTGIFQAVSELLAAGRDMDRAERGAKPSRIAQADAAQAERDRAEQDRKAKIAAEQRRRDQEVENERSLAEAQQRRKEAQRAAEQGVTAAEQGMPEEGIVVDSRFPIGPRGFGPPGGFGGPRGPGGFRGNEFGPGASRPAGPRFGPPVGGPFPGPPRMPAPPDMTGGVTITMEDAGAIDTREMITLFKPLSVAVSANRRNRSLTVRLAYQGPLEDVIKLIDFGDVVSSDDTTRTIVLKPK